MARVGCAAGILVALWAGTLGGCGGVAARPMSPAETARRPFLTFSYEAVDGRSISNEAFAHRVSVIGFLTTYDVPSQVEARFLAMLASRHAPRLNVAVLMLEASDNKPLVDAFAQSLGVPYPVALADASTIAGEGPFAGLHHVPSVVILDRHGREAFRHVGFLDEVTLERAVREAEAIP